MKSNRSGNDNGSCRVAFLACECVMRVTLERTDKPLTFDQALQPELIDCKFHSFQPVVRNVLLEWHARCETCNDSAWFMDDESSARAYAAAHPHPMRVGIDRFNSDHPDSNPTGTTLPSFREAALARERFDQRERALRAAAIRKRLTERSRVSNATFGTSKGWKPSS